MDIDFERLIHLQNLDAQIKGLSLFLESVPANIEQIDQQISDSLSIINSAKDKLARNQKKRRDLEADIQDTKSHIARYQRQLNEVKTNKEYSSLLKGIEEAQEKIESIEEEIIGEMLNADDIETEIKKAESKAEEIKEKLSKDREQLVQKERESEEKRKQMMMEKDKMIPTIPANQMNLYSMIFRKNNGIVLSPVTDDFCSMCQIRIRPQVINELIAKSQIILCENCGRILYLEKK